MSSRGLFRFSLAALSEGRIINYYPFHIGDYLAHTAHLSPLEDIAYRRMLDLYYLNESPLPCDAKKVARLVRMLDQIDAVQTVLDEFFTASADGWRHDRCDEELAKMSDKREKAQASAAASVAARRKPKSPENAGSAPAEQKSDEQQANAERTLNERSTNAQRTLNEGSATNTNTNTNTKEEASTTTESPPTVIAREENADSGGGGKEPPEDEGDRLTAERFLAAIRGSPGGDDPPVEPTPHGAMAVELRRRGVRCTSQHPDLLALLADGFTIPEVVEALAVASMQDSAPKPMNVGYLASVARTQREIAKRPKRAAPAWWANETATLAKGREVGLQPRGGEDWASFRQRIRERLASDERAQA